MFVPHFDSTDDASMRFLGKVLEKRSRTREDRVVTDEIFAEAILAHFDAEEDAAATLPGSRTLFVNWGSAAHDASGGSRAAQYMLFDQAIREVREPATAGEGALLMPEGRAALKGYLAGGRVVFYVERASDIREVVRFARARGMKPVIAGGTEAWVVARTPRPGSGT